MSAVELDGSNDIRRRCWPSKNYNFCLMVRHKAGWGEVGEGEHTRVASFKCLLSVECARLCVCWFVYRKSNLNMASNNLFESKLEYILAICRVCVCVWNAIASQAYYCYLCELFI